MYTVTLTIHIQNIETHEFLKKKVWFQFQIQCPELSHIIAKPKKDNSKLNNLNAERLFKNIVSSGIESKMPR